MSAVSTVMVRRNLRHTARNPLAVFNAVVFPVVIMLMFVYVFGGAFEVGVDYIDYATPGLIMMAISYGLGVTAIAVNADVTKGIVNRLKVMDISSGSMLIGHVVATVLRGLVAVAAVVGTAVLVGFGPAASPLDWLAAIGLVVLVCTAASWLMVAIGLSAKTPESASIASVPLIMLPFLSSAFVPADTMGPGVRQFAEYQPFTPIIETLRGLLVGSPDAADAVAAVGWGVGVGLVGYVWAVMTFRRQM